MKKIKKNQVIIAVMTVALGVAGYINFSGNLLNLADSDEKKNGDTQAAFNEDIVDADIADANVYNEHIVLEDDMYATGEVYSEAEIGDTSYDDAANTDISINPDETIELNSDTSEIGEAVLTTTPAISDSIITARINREQVRSRSQEAYLAIINGETSDGISVEDATQAYLKLTENMGREADTETILAAKGFPNAVVSISESSVDVIIPTAELDGAQRAQIEEIVVRKTGCTVDQIVITCNGQANE